MSSRSSAGAPAIFSFGTVQRSRDDLSRFAWVGCIALWGGCDVTRTLLGDVQHLQQNEEKIGFLKKSSSNPEVGFIYHSQFLMVPQGFCLNDFPRDLD